MMSRISWDTSGKWSVGQEEQEAFARSASAAIRDMKEGRAVTNDALWGSVMFQVCIKNELAKMGALQKEADKLAVIKEVFGGKS